MNIKLLSINKYISSKLYLSFTKQRYSFNLYKKINYFKLILGKIVLFKLLEKPLNSHFDSYLNIIPMGFETSLVIKLVGRVFDLNIIPMGFETFLNKF